MNIYYRREIKGNYLIVEIEKSAQSNYGIKMMGSNTIEGLLNFRVKYNDQREIYCYEITSKQPLNRVLETRTISIDEIRKVILNIGITLERMEKYLLKEESILLEEEYIYIEPDTFQLYFCVVPGYKCNFIECLGQLLQYILKKVDRQDVESVVLAYGLFQESQKENYGIQDLLKLINNNTKKEEKYSDQSDFDLECNFTKEDQEQKLVTKVGSKKPWMGTILFMIGMPLTLWLIKGISVIKAYWVYLVGWELLCLIFLFFPAKGYLKNPESEEAHSDIFSQSEKEAKGEMFRQEKVVEYDKKRYVEQQTVLLVDFEKEEQIRQLVCLTDEMQDICILYYPFIIGKQEDAVDYVIEKDTVSRFHIRIDQVHGDYYITDLNSTNGTRIRGTIIDANSTVQIYPEDEIQIADIGYRFA